MGSMFCWECRKLALVLASQLPQDRVRAQLTIEYLRDIAADYWPPVGVEDTDEGQPPRRERLSVVGGSSDGCGASPSRRASSSDSPPVSPK